MNGLAKFALIALANSRRQRGRHVPHCGTVAQGSHAELADVTLAPQGSNNLATSEIGPTRTFGHVRLCAAIGERAGIERA